MINFKRGFLAVIALFAMSFTIASREGLFKKNFFSRKKSYTCSTFSDIASFDYCIGSVKVHVSNTSTLAGNIPAAGTCTFNDVLAPASITCDETQTYFCCMQKGPICPKPSCAGPADVAGAKIGTIHFNSTHQ